MCLIQIVADQSSRLPRYIGRRLVAQIAEECFRGVTAISDRSTTEIETAAENVLRRIEVNARDLLIGQGADPDGEQWSLVWGAMELRYRERLAKLMIEAGLRGTERVQ